MNERDRIELLMKCYDLSASQFADKTGIQRASVSHILSGRNKPSLEVMLKIYEAFPGLDMKWLMTGVGEEPVAHHSALESSNGLFGDIEDDTMAAEPVHPFVNMFAQDVPLKKTRVVQEKVRQADSVEKRKPRQAQQPPTVQRKIKEVRVFYTDGTYEILLPERN